MHLRVNLSLSLWEKIKDILVNKGGLLLQADPGTGKTYTAKNIASQLDKVRKIAPTNKASLNLKGSTIHKFLNMDIEGNISTRQLNKIKRNYEYIIVDEVSMITQELWRRLVFLKQATGVKFLLLGVSLSRTHAHTHTHTHTHLPSLHHATRPSARK